MGDDKMATAMRGYVKALAEKDVEKALSFLAPEAEQATPSGTFKGQADIRRYLRWLFETNSELSVAETGIGIVTMENKAAFEHTLRGVIRDRRWELPMVCTYRFAGDKIDRIVTVYDRLSLAKQVTKGWMAQRAINAVIGATEQGLE